VERGLKDLTIELVVFCQLDALEVSLSVSANVSRRPENTTSYAHPSVACL
jgi:hypothetical protein